MTFLQKLKTVFYWPILLAKKDTVGGQAIIEGVMMRGPQKVAWAVRKPDKTVAIENMPFISITKKYKLLALPFFRGVVNLVESLNIGYKTLMRSAELATPEPEKTDEKPQKKGLDSFYSFLSLALSLVISLALFVYLPMWLSSLMFDKTSALYFNMVSGFFRIVLFLCYLLLLRMWKEMRRIFEYHGAEHKAIATFEANKQLTIETMQTFSKLHPRCGTSFLLIVGIICILLFSIIDALVILFIGPYPNIPIRFLVHLALIPLVSGASYEILKISGRYSETKIGSLLIKPGLWLQKITTCEPDNDQLEIAASALKSAL